MPHRHFPRTIPGDPNPPSLITFLGLHGGLGTAGGVVFAALVILSNFGGIRELLHESSEPFIPMLLFFVSCALTFGAIKMATAIMSLPFEPDDDSEGKDHYREPPEPPQPRD